MRLDLESRLRILQRRARADVDHGAMKPTLDVRVRGVHTVRRYDQRVRVKVRRGKAELPAKLIAANHIAGERIGAPQHLAGGVEIPGVNRLADARAADHLAV